MRYFMGLVLALALGVMGCSETSGTGGAAGDGGSGGVGGGGGQAGGETGTLTIFPMEVDADGARPLAGVRVCEIDTDNCGVTDGVNPLELQMPADQEIAYTQVKDGYDSYLRPDILKPEPGSHVPVIPVMRTSAFVADMHRGLMSPYPPEGTGAVIITVWTGAAGGPLPGATVEFVDGAGKTFYVDDDGTWRSESDLTATTSASQAGFVEVPPGEAQVRIGGAAKDCEVIRGWPGEEENTVRMLVREGFTTAPRVRCSN